MPSSPPRAHLSTALVFLALALVVLQGWLAARQAAQDVLRAETRVIGSQLAGRLETCIDTRVALVEAMALEWAAGGLRDEPSFRARATSLIETFPGYQAINLVGADGVIERVHPVAGNEAALGRNIEAHPTAAHEVAKARDTRELQISRPLELYQGGLGFTFYVPLVERDGQLGGFLNGAFRSTPMFETCVGPLDHFVLEVEHDGTVVYRSPGEATAGASSFFVPLGAHEMELRVFPSASGSAEHAGPSALGLVAGIGASGLIAFLYGRNRRARKERALMAEELQRARRLESLGRLAAGVAHDFNNLLTVLQFGAESLRFTRDETARNARLDEMDRAISRAVGLTSQMLTLGRRHATGLQPTRIVGVVRGMEVLLRRLLPEGVTLDLQIAAPDDATIQGDAVRIEQIVLNLVTNAGDAYQGGGVVHVGLSQLGDRVLLRVADDGRGMDAATLRRMYEPFFTTKGPSQGTGLGLATVYGHVQAMNATIEVDSAPGAGTRFVVRWPLAVEPPAPLTLDPPRAERPALRATFEHARVLLVEDSDLVRNATLLALASVGYDVVEACDGLEAIARLAQDPTIAAVVTDALMPQAGGGEVIEWAAAHRPALPIVLVSALADGGVDASSARRESVFLVAKPYAPAVLQDTVAAALAWARGRA